MTDEAMKAMVDRIREEHWPDFDNAVRAAIIETRDRDAALADMYFAACVPTPIMGDDDSIHLTDFEEGEKRAAFVIREKILSGKHYGGQQFRKDV